MMPRLGSVRQYSLLPGLYKAEEYCDEKDQHHGHQPDHQAKEEVLLLPLLLHLVHQVLCRDHLQVSCLVVEPPCSVCGEADIESGMSLLHLVDHQGVQVAPLAQADVPGTVGLLGTLVKLSLDL